MSRIYNTTTIAILQYLVKRESASFAEVKKACAPSLSEKDFYNYIFRLQQQELVKKAGESEQITEEGKKLLLRLMPERDGIWKLVIFDIPEKHKYVRRVLRAKLKQLHFKKWQNSIWVSPYALDKEIEEEFESLGKKFFVRLIKTTQINQTEDLDRLFEDS
jgi:DNA-binding transcriptional regulator PaaX